MPLPTGYSARAFFSQADLDKQNWYNDQINAYKEKADAYNAAVETYKQQIEDYNKKVEEWNAGPRTKEFGYKEPTFTATKPEDLSFTQEDLDQFQVDAASRAQRSQANRQAAYDIAQDPSAYNLAGFAFAQGGMVRGYEGGGDVERDPLDVGGEVPTTEEDQAKFLEFITNAGLDMAPVTGEVRSAQSALEEFKKGNYGMGTLDAAGAVPFLGMAVRGGRKLLPSILALGDKVTDAMNSLKDRQDALKEMLPASVPNERGLMTDPVEEFAKTNPEEAAELADVSNRIAKMNTASMTDKTEAGTLRAGGFPVEKAEGGEIEAPGSSFILDALSNLGGLFSSTPEPEAQPEQAPALTNEQWMANYYKENPEEAVPLAEPEPLVPVEPLPKPVEGLSDEELKYMFPPPKTEDTDKFIGKYLKGTAMLPVPDAFKGEYRKGTTTLPMPAKPEAEAEPEKPVSRAKEAMDTLVPDTAPKTTPTLDIWTEATAMGERGAGLMRNTQGNYLVDALNPFGDVGVKTEKDMSKPALDLAKRTVKAVFDSGRKAATSGEGAGGVQLKYGDLPPTRKGSRPEHIVGAIKGQQGDAFTKAQETEGGLFGIGMSDDPVIQFATSIGNATIYEENGDLYLYDSYDFSPSVLSDLQSGYSMFRHLMGRADKAQLIENYPSLLKLGKASDIIGKDWEAKIKNSGIKGLPKERVDFIKRYMQQARD